MEEEWENSSIRYKIMDCIGNNHIWNFLYTRYYKKFELTGNETILDFGSGSGAGSKYFAKKIQNKGGSLTCLDTSKYWTGVAKKRLKKYFNINFLTNDISNCKFPCDYFDIINIHFVLHDVNKPDRNRIVAEFNRILKKSGKLHIMEPQRENDGMPVNEIEELMNNNGFKKLNSINKHNVFTAIYVKGCL